MGGRLLDLKVVKDYGSSPFILLTIGTAIAAGSVTLFSTYAGSGAPHPRKLELVINLKIAPGLTRSSNESADVCFWHSADIPMHSGDVGFEG
jgi:hypothetical protein